MRSPFSFWVRRRALALAVAVALLALPACKPGGRVAVHPVHGKVLFRGKPASGANVVLNPVGDDKPGQPRPAGVVGPDGSFRVTTYEADDGAPPGEYVVSVVWVVDRNDKGATYSPLPARYMSPVTSGLKATVREGDNELSPIQLR